MVLRENARINRRGPTGRVPLRGTIMPENLEKVAAFAACGTTDPAPACGTACGSADPEATPACGSADPAPACGSADPKAAPAPACGSADPAPACGTACGAADAQ